MYSIQCVIMYFYTVILLVVQYFKNLKRIQQIYQNNKDKVEINGLKFFLKSQVYEKYKK